MIIRIKHDKNFTIISNALIYDGRLTPTAFKLLVVMLSLPDDWQFYHNELIKRVGIGRSALTTAIAKLKELGYLTCTKFKNETGRWVYDYTVYEKPYIDNLHTEQADMVKEQLLNTNTTKTKTTNIDYINRESCEQAVKTKIEYDILIKRFSNNKRLIDMILSTIVSALLSKKKSLRVNSENIKSNLVKAKLGQLDFSHIEYVVECVGNSNKEVSDFNALLLTSLYNSIDTIDSYYQNIYNKELYNAGLL